MSSPFSRSLRSLSADDGRATSAGIAVALALLALWGAWLLRARVPVYEQSAAARVEAVAAAFNVESAVAGRVAESALTLGARVREGDTLLVLDDSEQALQRREAEARLEAVRPQVDALLAQRAAWGATLREATGAGGAAVEAARSSSTAGETLSTSTSTRPGSPCSRVMRGLRGDASASSTRTRPSRASEPTEVTRAGTTPNCAHGNPSSLARASPV